MLNDGRPLIEVIKELQITEATWYRLLNQYGSEKSTEASKRTKELEKENARLKAATPAAGPELLKWLGALDDPAVNEALRRREQAQQVERAH